LQRGMSSTMLLCRALSTAALAVLPALPPSVGAQSKRAGNPESQLPSNIVQLTGFGERPSWSPDDKRVAFMSKSFGDAFEVDVATRTILPLTGHFVHAAFLRLHYLPHGAFFLIGTRTYTDILTTPARDQAMWVLTADAGAA